MFTKYDKFLIGLLGVVLTGLNVMYHTNANVQLLISLLTAAGVYSVPNKL